MLAAAIVCSAKGEGPVQSCRVCRTSRRLRAEWGCDGPSAEPWGYLGCPFCAGDSPECTACAGTGQIPQSECPHRVVTERELGLIAAFAMVENGVLPDPGGWNDQAATFVSAYPFGAREIHSYRERALNPPNRRAGSPR